MRRAWVAVVVLAAALVAHAAAAQGPPAAPAQQPGEAKTMTDAARAKLDAYLKQAFDDRRPDLLRVMLRLAGREGADARLRELLAKLELKVERTMSGGRLLLTTLKAERLADLAASDDVAGISFDAVVTPQAPK
jgi:hypothetical protein